MKPNFTALIYCIGLFSCATDDKDGSGDTPGDLYASNDESFTCDDTLDSDGDGLDDCTEEDLGFDPAAEDGDGDGIADSDEVALGLDPTTDDTDGDGFLDGDEVDCGADPNDASVVCYACGWKMNDPGDIESSGSGLGDVMSNVALIDQCGEMVDFYDFAGEYHILYMTAAF